MTSERHYFLAVCEASTLTRQTMPCRENAPVGYLFAAPESENENANGRARAGELRQVSAYQPEYDSDNLIPFLAGHLQEPPRFQVLSNKRWSVTQKQPTDCG